MIERLSFEREMHDLGLKEAEVNQSFRSPLFQGDADLLAVLNGRLRLGRQGDPQYSAPIKSKGEAISKVQRALIGLGYLLPIYGANGDYNEETYKAVYDYKNRYGIRTETGFLDGIVGIKTIKHLDNAMAERKTTIPSNCGITSINLMQAISKNRSYGMSLGWDAYHSSIMRFLGFDYGFPDEKSFAQAVACWQKRRGNLEVDGIIGPKTLSQMLPELQKKQVPYSNSESGEIADLDREQVLQIPLHRSTYKSDYGMSEKTDYFTIKTPLSQEGHEYLTRSASSGLGLTPEEESGLRIGVRRVDELEWRINPLAKHFDAKQMKRHSLRMCTCQEQHLALAHISSQLRLLYRRALEDPIRKSKFEWIGEALHLIQDSYCPAHVERDWQSTSGRFPIIWIRFFGYQGSSPAPLEHGLLNESRDIIELVRPGLQLTATKIAIEASREFLQMIIRHIPLAPGIAFAELIQFEDKHLSLDPSRSIPTKRHYPRCPGYPKCPDNEEKWIESAKKD